MARLLFLLSYVLTLSYQVKSQIIRSPLSVLSRRYTEAIIDAPRNYVDAPRVYADAPRNYIDAPRVYADAPRNYVEIPIDGSRNYINIPRIVEASRSYIQPQPTLFEPPCNNILPMNAPGMPNVAPSTTIITDCTPSVCKNLADTINLMIFSNLLQNFKGGDQLAMQVAAPFLKDIMSKSGFAGYPNPISNYINPNLIAPNVVSPNFLPQTLIAPNLSGSSVYGPNSVAPRLVIPNSVAPGSNSVSPNASINNSALLSNLLKLLGGAV